MNNIDKIRKSVGMIGESDNILEMLSLISQVALTDISVHDLIWLDLLFVALLLLLLLLLLFVHVA